jgi:hypothetical protein
MAGICAFTFISEIFAWVCLYLRYPNFCLPILRLDSLRKGARAVERDGLENRCTGNCTEGSNPSLSANKHIKECQIPANSTFAGIFRLGSMPKYSNLRKKNGLNRDLTSEDKFGSRQNPESLASSGFDVKKVQGFLLKNGQKFVTLTNQI